jgi:hypothetical protein
MAKPIDRRHDDGLGAGAMQRRRSRGPGGLVEEKIEHPNKAAPAPSKKPQATNVIDLVSVLQENLQKLKSKPAVKKVGGLLRLKKAA